MRRLAAGLLATLAAVLALAPAPAEPRADVVVATRDLAAGDALAPTDVALRPWPREATPSGVLGDAARAVGRVPVGGVRAGEPLTDVRLLGPEAATSAAGRADAAGVPLRLADPGVAAVLRPGARVDVIAAGDAGSLPRAGPVARSGPPGGGARAGAGGAVEAETDGVVAAGAVVLAVLAPPERSTAAPVIVVALPAADAARVAVTALSREVTVTLR